MGWIDMGSVLHKSRGDKATSLLKVVPGLNVFAPVQKILYFQETPLKVSKDFDEISLSSKVRIQSTESFERPGVRIHGALDRGAGVVDDVMERSSHCLFQSVPSDSELIQHTRIDDMDIGLINLSMEQVRTSWGAEGFDRRNGIQAR